MGPFRWPEIKYDLALARQVASSMPEKPAEWDAVAAKLSVAFSSNNKVVDVKGRGCRERIGRLISKHKQEDAKALKRSGTEEEYTELSQLCEDIASYRRDMDELKNQEKEAKKKKEEEDRKKAEEMRSAAVEGLSKRRHSSASGTSGHSSSDETIESGDDSTSACSAVGSGTKGPKKRVRHRAGKLTAVKMLEDKYNKKAEQKDKELEIRKLELEFQKTKYEAEAEERKVKLELEFEERKVMLALLKDRL